MPHQVSVFAENKPGKISRITGILSDNGINIRAITISDQGDYGIIKLLLDKPQQGNDCLQAEGFASTLKDIVAIKIDDSPGGLHKAASLLSGENINVEDAYGFTIREKNLAVFVFQVADVTHTEKILQKAGFNIVSDNELYYI
ncbi:MAG TPA: ACT domain-containing protein [Spirochaetota bacterium]|nr:ACT domain-containing protein [Spirochaetota bacterium]HPJ34051.1 ACT domain-containing protein [Spirochaetota bacterium]